MPVPDRNSTVDTLRTAALIGICVVNLPFMGLPQGAVLTAPDGLWNQAAALFTGIFFEAKFFMLFSFLFGWGIEIQQRSAERAGASAGRRYGRRLVMLALFGIAHAIFVFSGDLVASSPLSIGSGNFVLNISIAFHSASSLANKLFRRDGCRF